VQTERGLVLTLEDGTFDKDLAVIKPGARRGLDQLAKFLHDNPGRRVQIEAFTDGEGSSVYNLELSQDRADAGAMAVINRGVEARARHGLGRALRRQRQRHRGGPAEEPARRDHRLERGRRGSGPRREHAMKTQAGEFFSADFGAGLADGAQIESEKPRMSVER